MNMMWLLCTICVILALSGAYFCARNTLVLFFSHDRLRCYIASGEGGCGGVISLRVSSKMEEKKRNFYSCCR